MMDLETMMLIIGSVILIGFAGRITYRWTRVPESLFLIAFGLIIGPLTNLVDGSSSFEIIQIVFAAALITILIESGVTFDISRLMGHIGIAALFTLMIAAITTLLVAGMLVFFLNWNVLHALLLGLISSGTTTVTAMALLHGLNVSEKVRGLIMLETIINDFTLVVGTFLIVNFIKFEAFDLPVALQATFFDLTIGIMFGFTTAFVWRHVLSAVNIRKELNYASTIGVCFLLYYFAKAAGGSSVIAVFCFALVLGNYLRIIRSITPEKKRIASDEITKSIVSVQNDFAFFMKTFFFVLLGITFDISLLSKIPLLLIAGILAMIILGRAISVTVISRIDHDYAKYRAVIASMIPRGALAAVLAFIPMQEGIEIPLFTDIVVILVLLTTLVAIVGVSVFGRKAVS